MRRALLLLPICLAACERPGSGDTPAEVTGRIGEFAARHCGVELSPSIDAGYLRAADISKDGRPDYVVDFAALDCGGQAPAPCDSESGCPREVWVSDGREMYKLAFGMDARAFEVNADATPPTISATLAGAACPAPAAPARGAALLNPATGARVDAEAACVLTFVFDPIRLEFVDAERGLRAAPADDRLD